MAQDRIASGYHILTITALFPIFFEQRRFSHDLITFIGDLAVIAELPLPHFDLPSAVYHISALDFSLR